ncbi:alginate lyase family protein [Kushneria sp. TE3]|uniref:alginate lyase family protein n=1 Tax=Kushneria sp. TE3 TaxID=3449832 RepID=UPI003F682F0D
MNNDSSDRQPPSWQQLLKEKDKHAQQLEQHLNDKMIFKWFERFDQQYSHFEETLKAQEQSLQALEDGIVKANRRFERRSTAVSMMECETQQSDVSGRRYQNSSPDSETNDFVLFRIIGNDLYPRHKKGQSRENLRFILEKEQPLENCIRYWLVNRIVDADEEQQILSLLEEFDQQWVRIPFNTKEYQNIGLDMSCLPESGYLASREFMALDDEKRNRVMTAMYRHKNNYVMNNNGARNKALKEGKKLAKWVLPWDGNCFLTPRAWRRIREDILEKPWLQYFVVPMTRVQNNDQLINDNFQPDAVEEPQIVFRHDSSNLFDESFCYGRRPKVELFWRLGVPGKWDHWRDEPWDRPRSTPGPNAGQYGLAGWVARLSSGMLELEQHNNISVKERFKARQNAIIETLHLMDRKVSDDTVSWSAPSIDIKNLVDKRELYHSGSDSFVIYEIEKLLEDANSIIEKQRSSDYLTNESSFFNYSMILALAWFFNGDHRHAVMSARLFRRFFFCCTATTDTIAETDETVRIEMEKLLPAHFMGNAWCYPDVMALLERAGVLSGTEISIFKSSLRQYLVWLQESETGKNYCAATNELGTCVDLQIAAIASYTDDKMEMKQALLRSLCRFNTQFASDGSIPALLGDRNSRTRCRRNLQAWINLFRLAGRSNPEFVNHVSTKGITLQTALLSFLSFDAKSWPYTQHESFDEQCLQPLYAFVGHSDDANETHVAREPKATFPESHGIRPYWYLEI